MVSILKEYLPGNDPYVGVVHRLDQPVAGVMVYAKTKEAAAALSSQVASGSMTKHYRAVLCGVPKAKKGELKDYLIKDDKDNISRVCDAKTKGAKEARLIYKITESRYTKGKQYAMAEIELITGRHHQIRVQFASRGTPLMGDHRYNPEPEGDRLCLESCSLRFVHPKTRKEMSFKLPESGLKLPE